MDTGLVSSVIQYAYAVIPDYQIIVGALVFKSYQEVVEANRNNKVDLKEISKIALKDLKKFV